MEGGGQGSTVYSSPWNQEAPEFLVPGNIQKEKFKENNE